jgi:predicted DNA-binding transcriptional regulator AlpA
MTTTAPATAPADPDLITLQDFLRRFSVSKSSFYRLAARGEAPPVAKLGRATFVPLAAARAWLQSRVVPAATLIDPSRTRPAKVSDDYIE